MMRLTFFAERELLKNELKIEKIELKKIKNIYHNTVAAVRRF